MPKDISSRGKVNESAFLTEKLKNNAARPISENITQDVRSKKSYSKQLKRKDVFDVSTKLQSKLYSDSPSSKSHTLTHQKSELRTSSMVDKLAKHWRMQIPQVKIRLLEGDKVGQVIDGSQYYSEYLSEDRDAEFKPGTLIRSMNVEVIIEVPGAERIINLGPYFELCKEKRSEVFVKKVLQLPQDERLVRREDGRQAIAVVSIMLADGVLGLKEPILATQLDRFLPKEKRLEAYSAAMRTFLWARDIRLFKICIDRGGSVAYRSLYGNDCMIEIACKCDDSRFLEICLDYAPKDCVNLLRYLLDSNRYEIIEMKRMIEDAINRLDSSN